MSTLEEVLEDIKSVRAELAELRRQEGYSINDPYVVALNYRLAALTNARTSLSASARASAAPLEGVLEKMQRQLDEVQEACVKRTSFISNTMTRAEMVEHERSRGNLAHSAEFDGFLNEHRVRWWPQNASRKFPRLGQSDRGECQAFVANMLSRLSEKTVEVEVMKGKRKEKVSVEIRNIPDENAYRRKSVLRRSPDVTLYNGQARGEGGISMLGEVKGSKVGTFQDDEVGQLMRDIMRLLRHQMFRAILIGFLTDGNRFQFVRGVRQRDGDLLFDTSRILMGTDGWQTLFGLMVADPAIIGHTPLVIPGYTVDSLLGKGAFSVVYKAIKVTEASSSQEETIEIRSPQLPAPWAVHTVLGDGNCFFHAVADQLQRQDVRDASGAVYTHESLRTMTLNAVNDHPSLRALLTDEELLDLARLQGYVDHGAIAAMAVALHHDIVVYQPGGCVRFDAAGRVHLNHRDNASRQALRVVYNGHDHYDSVVPAPGGSLRRKRRRDAEETKGDEPPPSKRVKAEPQEVVVKVFPHRRREMRTNEQTVLRALAPHRHIPVVVSSCDLKDGPALIVTPVGRPVLPVKNGVRAWVPSYLNLLAVLQHAHSQGICHRDVKPQNIFIDVSGGVFLNDWGSAARIGQETPWAGTEFFYTARYETHCPSPAEDLVAFVRSVFLMYTNQLPSAAVRRFLQHSPSWQRALSLASRCDYDGLRNWINTL